MENLDYISFSSSNHHAKSKRGKARENLKKERQKSDTLSSIELDYVANLSSTEEDFTCLGETELLESLDKLNFNFAELGSQEQKSNSTKQLRQKKTKELSADESGSSENIDYYPVDSFNQLNRDIKLFLKSNDDKFETSPAPPDIRRFIHLLGNLYRLKTFSVGKGIEKRIVLERTEYSGLANNTRQVDKIIEQGNKAIKYANGEESNKSYRDKSSRKSKKKSNNVNDSAKPIDGAIVGGNSVPIKDDNVGNKMLQKMGWTAGTGLGRDSSGITDHIHAVVKTKRTGLI